MIRKNVANQYVAFYAWLDTADTPVTGDAANISGFVSLDGAAEAPATNAASELDAVNAPGVYLLQLSQAESNADLIIASATSTTANVQMKPFIAHTIQWLYDGLTFDVILDTLMAVLANVATKSGSVVTFMNRDGTTTQLAVTHDTTGARTVSTVT